MTLPVGGLYKLRQRGEPHAFDGRLIHLLQEAVATDSFSTYRRYAEAVRRLPPIALRDLLDFRSEWVKPIPVDEVESDHRNPQAAAGPRHFAGRAEPGSA